MVCQNGNYLYPGQYSQTNCRSQIGWYGLWGENNLMAIPSTFMESMSWWSHDWGKFIFLSQIPPIPIYFVRPVKSLWSESAIHSQDTEGCLTKIRAIHSYTLICTYNCVVLLLLLLSTKVRECIARSFVRPPSVPWRWSALSLHKDLTGSMEYIGMVGICNI